MFGGKMGKIKEFINIWAETTYKRSALDGVLYGTVFSIYNCSNCSSQKDFDGYDCLATYGLCMAMFVGTTTLAKGISRWYKRREAKSLGQIIE
jgi:hypothetical protein